MIIRVISYFVLLIILIYLSLLLVGRKSLWFSVAWKKALVYCIAFLLFVIGCFALDCVLNTVGVWFCFLFKIWLIRLINTILN